MVCSESSIDAGFAFAVLTELLVIFPFFILAALYTVDKIPRRLVSTLLFVACPVLILFSIISIATVAECRDLVDDLTLRAAFSFSTGIRAMLLGIFLIFLILVNKFAFNGNWFLGEETSTAKSSTTPQSSPQHTGYPGGQTVAQAMPYTAQSPVAQNVPVQQGVPTQPPVQTATPPTTLQQTQ